MISNLLKVTEMVSGLAGSQIQVVSLQRVSPLLSPSFLFALDPQGWADLLLLSADGSGAG